MRLTMNRFRARALGGPTLVKYSVALGFDRGHFDIHGDLISADRFKMEATRRGLCDLLTSIVARIPLGRIESWFQTHARAARNILSCYDRSNEFYGAVPGFADALFVCVLRGHSLESGWQPTGETGSHLPKARSAAGRDLSRHRIRLGNVGVRAAEKYGAIARGCTLSFREDVFAAKSVAERNIENRNAIHECDYRDTAGEFSKIVSVDLFEHAGRCRLRAAIVESVRKNLQITILIVEFFDGVFERRMSAKSIDGPIEIGEISGQAAGARAPAIPQFVAAISLNFCLFNLLPTPSLMGGVIWCCLSRPRCAKNWASRLKTPWQKRFRISQRAYGARHVQRQREDDAKRLTPSEFPDD